MGGEGDRWRRTGGGRGRGRGGVDRRDGIPREKNNSLGSHKDDNENKEQEEEKLRQWKKWWCEADMRKTFSSRTSETGREKWQASLCRHADEGDPQSTTRVKSGGAGDDDVDGWRRSPNLPSASTTIVREIIDRIEHRATGLWRNIVIRFTAMKDREEENREYRAVVTRMGPVATPTAARTELSKLNRYTVQESRISRVCYVIFHRKRHRCCRVCHRTFVTRPSNGHTRCRPTLGVHQPTTDRKASFSCKRATEDVTKR